MRRAVEEMKKYRGEIEGGICLRRVGGYVPDTEQRFFVILRSSVRRQNRSGITRHRPSLRRTDSQSVLFGWTWRFRAMAFAGRRDR